MKVLNCNGVLLPTVLKRGDHSHLTFCELVHVITGSAITMSNEWMKSRMCARTL